jgi:hypothetical protein
MSIADIICANQIRIAPCSDQQEQEDHAKPVERRVSGPHATHEKPRHAARACRGVLSRLSTAPALSRVTRSERAIE